VSIPLSQRAINRVEATPHLTYQILTKRAGNVARKLASLNRRLPASVAAGFHCECPKIPSCLQHASDGNGAQAGQLIRMKPIVCVISTDAQDETYTLFEGRDGEMTVEYCENTYAEKRPQSSGRALMSVWWECWFSVIRPGRGDRALPQRASRFRTGLG
jgi:protein gp37